MCFRDFVPLVVPCSSVFSLPLDSILHLLFWSPSPTFYHLLKSICVFFLELIVVSKSLVFSIYFPCSSQVVNVFSSCIPFSANQEVKCLCSSLSLLDHSFPDIQALTLTPSNYITRSPGYSLPSLNTY